MNVLFRIALGFLFLVGCTGKKANDQTVTPDDVHNPVSVNSDGKDALPVIEFDTPKYDFGEAHDGEKISYSYHFRNTGKGNLVIRHCQASCGCTVPEWPKDPIQPGGEGFITVTFDTKGKVGMQHKTVTIIANTIPNTTTISITGEVMSLNTAPAN